MSASSCNTRTILDIPDEILIKIISHFNIRKRLLLANSCSRFNSIIFGDERLLGDLDFSKKGRLTRAEDIEQYFRNEKTLELVRKVNIENVNCVKPGKMLNNTIGRAIYLVDINVHGIKFLDIEQLGSFLEPLVHVKRLSVDWPKSKNDVKICRKVLQEPLSRLKYFSVKVYIYSVEFLPTVKLCQELEELRIITTESRHSMRRMSWDLEPNKLMNLKIVQVRGPQTMQIKKHLINMLADIEKWTDFQLTDISREPGFYLEKNVEVCEELSKTNLNKGIPYQRENPAYDIGWFLIPEYLLQEVIRITHQNVPKTFCCFTPILAPLEQDKEPCLLNVDEAKRLLEDPRHQISFLYFKHCIESDCDAHLVASAFPNLTELVLSNIIKSRDTVSTSRKKNQFRRFLRRKDSSEPEEQDNSTNLDSSFKMLVENTPKVKDLTIHAENDWIDGLEQWDVTALSLIPRWKNLTTLRLAFVPIVDGMFLVEIGKECLKFEKIVLKYLGADDPGCYTSDLAKMLSHCRNLKEFSIEERYIENMPDVLTSLSNNSKLKKLGLTSSDEQYEFYKPGNLILSIEELLRQCKKLNTFVFVVRSFAQKNANELSSALQRIKRELNRPNFQFRTATDQYSRDSFEPANSETIHEDASSSFFPCKLNGFDNK